MKIALEKYGIVLICLIGSLVRILYGYLYQPWLHAPDHLAWELIIEQGSFRYDHLIHYPHEGGSIIVSLLSSIVEKLSNFSSLTISAVILDFVVRFTQIFVVKKVFNSRMAFWFGVWTIFASPIMLPWGTLNFGLHYLSSIFPFVLLYLLYNYKGELKYQLLVGSFLGLSLWFSYSNAILIPVFVIYLLVSKRHIRNWGYSMLALGTVLALHLLVRQYADAGFGLHEFQLNTIRGEEFSLSEIDVWDRLSYVPQLTTNSQLVLPEEDSFWNIIKWTFYAFGVLTVIGLVISYKKRIVSRQTFIILPILVLFFGAYTLSPFFYDREYGGHVALRHLTYIAPLVALIIIWGLSTLKYKVVLVLFLLVGVIQSARLFSIEKSPSNPMIAKASGWVLAAKFGHDPAVIKSIIGDNPQKKDVLLEGVGWGTSTALFQDIAGKSEEEKNKEIERLIDLIEEYPEQHRSLLISGIEFSFSDQVTPRLDPDLLTKIKEKLESKGAPVLSTK